MSGKPASVGASRAGVAGSPRVLVYVAEPRQLEAGAAGPEPPPARHPPLDALYLPDNLQPHLSLPRGPPYRPNLDRPDHRNPSNAIFYKPLNETEGKLSVYGAADGVVQRADLCPSSRQCAKEPCIKNDNSRNASDGGSVVKRDCADQLGIDFCGVETFNRQLPVETLDAATYPRCTIPGSSDSTMHPVQQVEIRHGQNQFSESVTVHSGDIVNCSDRELSVSKGFVNYQFLEQSVSHQSIVNQSISILNQQVGVNRGIISEGDGGSGPQLVRTADGMVLAVLPAPVIAQPGDLAEPASRPVSTDSTQTVIVPLGWRRIVNSASVLYISPSGTALSTLSQLREYLQTAGTCKCGLPCPLRPETTFSFDPKVASKPYQAVSGAELTKLCNHKRKLLATLQARSQSPATPPPQNIEQKKVAATESTAVKKKMKKRSGFATNVSVSQLMVQRERSHGEIKSQDSEPCREVSSAIAIQRGNNTQQSCLSTFPPAQQGAVSQDGDIRQDTHVHRSSHYLTVNSGWISQHQENSDNGQKLSQSSAVSASSSINIGMPVLGTNGQIIGVNTGLSKHSSYKNISTISQNLEIEQKEDKKDVTTLQNSHSLNLKHPYKEEESQIFCGLNQPLTPEVMQKINEQQQIFIQQNQKQIEMKMKGFRTQIENISQNKQSQSQYVPQAQLVIQNGAVVKTNPAKTPPWQVKRNDSNFSNPITSPGPKLQKPDNTDYDEVNTNISEDSSSSYSSFSSNEQAVNQAMCSRVPPLPQHYTMMGQQWPATDTNKKKTKGNKGGKKKNSPAENKVVTIGCNGMRLLQDAKGMPCDDLSSNNVPSFMEDPNGYLAQQTVLLNNTISKQVGINSSYDNNQYDNTNNSCFVTQNQVEKIKPVVKSNEISNIYRHNVPNPSLSPTSIPDSSMLPDNVMPQCCKGCNLSMKNNSPEYTDNQVRLKYMKHNVYKMEIDGSHAISSPKHSYDDNPVTSTFIERSPTLNDNCGPIQAGTVSTSNVSLTETLQPPEPSPTSSNSSRNTDTPHSSGSNSSQVLPNGSYPVPSPACSNSGSCRDNFNSNPPTPGSSQVYAYNSPGPPNNQSITGTQMMHFISNHNVNKNLMEVDNISTMVGVKSGLKSSPDMYRLESRRRIENTMPGYCPPPHLGGGPAHSLIQTCYVQTFVTTMASGFSVTRDTVTSVLAGKANTATTSINASQANFIRPPPPPSINLATTYAIPNNQPDPFFNSVNLPTSYPLHIAGTTAQSMITKSPLEMVQNVIGNLPAKSETGITQSGSLSQLRKTCPTTPGQILISSTGQIIVSNNQMPPPPPKTTTATSAIQSSGAVTNVSASVTQVIPTVGTVQPMVNQPTVVVNTLPAPFVLQPPMVAVDGQVVQQNAVLPQIMTGGIVPGQSPNENTRQLDVKNHHSFVQGVAMLSPESLKKRNKKKKTQSPNITNVLQIAAPQPNPSNIMVHHTSPQHNTSPQFSPRNFQLSPNNNISPTPMLQALTILPGKSGTPAHIVMNGQGNTNNYGSQQIIANTSPSQQINLLQPVNLLNNASGVMPNFPAFQQFIVPNLGGMVMTADGTAIIQDNSTGMPMQLQLQAVNGQNVLTPMQNSSVFATGPNSGVVIRAQNQQSKIIQSQHSPGAQFLSPNGQVVMNGPNFNGQLSPLLANLSPTSVTFNTAAQMRPGSVQTQEYIQTNQAGQTLMVPLSPKRVSLASAPTNRGNPTFVHQNTTIVQQQTTLVSNSQGAAQVALAAAPHVRPFGDALGAKNKSRTLAEAAAEHVRVEEIVERKIIGGVRQRQADGDGRDAVDGHARHSVSTQTLVNQAAGAGGGGGACAGSAGAAGATGSPPDTTTHSPLGALEPAPSPRLCAARCLSTQANYADTTTESPEPADANSSAMVQCVSSSEQDMADSRDHSWSAPRNDFSADNDAQSMISNITLMRSNRPHNTVESTDIHYNQNMSTPSMNNQHIMAMTSNSYYDRTHTYKRKNEFGDGSTYRSDKIMRTNSYNAIHGLPKESEYDTLGISSHDKSHTRHFPSGSSSEMSSLPKLFDRHLGSGDGVEN
ncbi:uncharacterized protein LOC115445393 isoform X2 [Manduca sexta]|uniref:uncharacterized protein LOC115445393 isoform X2 n=1 Tax=Manduca sexta TaxID=7130 RepID=UPI00189046DC|nr:uncharacterized protein LOC115445393 isoform X2 [Manduca sexta]